MAAQVVEQELVAMVVPDVVVLVVRYWKKQKKILILN